MVSPKDLKALAKACRESGILSFKSPEFEFTLSDQAPKLHGNTKVDHGPQPDKIESDEPSDLDLLFWSSVPGKQVDENTQ